MSKDGTGKPGDARPAAIDAHVGSRVGVRRTTLGMSQQTLAAAIGVTFQQIQRYETGAGRITAGRLFDLSRALDVPFLFFFEGYDGEEVVEARAVLSGGSLARQTLDLVRAFQALRDPVRRLHVIGLVQEMAHSQDHGAKAESTKNNDPLSDRGA